MSRITNEFGLAAAAYPHGRIAVLLSRYPSVSGEELDELHSFISRAENGEIRYLQSLPGVRRKLDGLVKSLRGPGLRQHDLLWTGAAIALILAISWALWEKRPHPLVEPRPIFSTLSEAG